MENRLDYFFFISSVVLFTFFSQCCNHCIPGVVQFLDPPVIPTFFEKPYRDKTAIVLRDELGYTYNKSKPGLENEFNLKILWRCSNKSKQCKATCVVLNDQIIKRRYLHNHNPPQNTTGLINPLPISF